MGGTISSDRVFVVTYTPLVGSRAGREAVERYGLLPFTDGSIRREPDLEHARPSHLLPLLGREVRPAPSDW
jgi:hypothetical protein